ncbi:WD domain, G-beta repeat protein, partial [Teladorsagia circumcincta]
MIGGDEFKVPMLPNKMALVSTGGENKSEPQRCSNLKIFLWNVYGECENFSVIRGHSGAIMDIHFNTDSSLLVSCATDKTVRVWDMETGACRRKFKSHVDIVNACHPSRRGPQLVCSAGDDGLVK